MEFELLAGGERPADLHTPRAPCDMRSVPRNRATTGVKPSIAAVPTAVKSALTRKYNQSHCAYKKSLSSGPSTTKDRFTEEEEDLAEEGEDDADPDEGAAKPAVPRSHPRSCSPAAHCRRARC